MLPPFSGKPRLLCFTAVTTEMCSVRELFLERHVTANAATHQYHTHMSLEPSNFQYSFTLENLFSNTDSKKKKNQCSAKTRE